MNEPTAKKELKKTPFMSRVYFTMAIICMLTPTAMKMYTGETNRLIVASGKLSDPNFNESVVYISKHTVDGAIGVVINRPLKDSELKKAPGFLRDKKIPLYWGGPMGFPEDVVVLERASPHKDGSIHLVLKKFDDAVKEDPAYLDKIADAYKAGKEDYRIYLGTSGWGVFQLGTEFGKGVWASTELNPSWVFYKDMTPHDVWVKALSTASSKRKPRSPGTI